MVQPRVLLAGAVTVTSKLALPTVMELLLPLEAGVAHSGNEAGTEGENVIEFGGHHGKGPHWPSKDLGVGTGSAGHPFLSRL